MKNLGNIELGLLVAFVVLSIILFIKAAENIDGWNWLWVIGVPILSGGIVTFLAEKSGRT